VIDRKKKGLLAKGLGALFAIIILCVIWEIKAEAGSIYSSPYVELAPDGKAWTTCAGESHNEGYREGYTVDTGVESALRELQVGEHYYQYNRTGDIPIGQWVVEWEDAACIHSLKKEEDYHGLTFGDTTCGAYYTQGWYAYCADCHQKIAAVLMYLCEDAARSITSIPMGMDYYYLCPFCSHLEQGAGIPFHECEKISYNRYRVQYRINTTMELMGGRVPVDTYHMYNNATEYEGETVMPNTRLAKMKATVFGHEFVGWNTKPDGSGRWFGDAQEIYNLTEYDSQYDTRGIITLYAQWKKSESTLVVDPAGGSYLGNSGLTSYVKQAYDTQMLYPDAIVAPQGALLHFQTNGGESVPDIVSSQHFERWEASEPFGGRMQGNLYHFPEKGGNLDRLVAVYMPDAITLPDIQKENCSFGGWYYDETCKKPAGVPGDKIVIQEETTLYAHWVELKLDSAENYSVNSGVGAVDLWWNQPDLYQKAYRIYRYYSEEGEAPEADATWKLIHSTLDETDRLTVEQNFSYSGVSQQYEVPYTGIYKLTAGGAQGGNFGNYRGGPGGTAEGMFWLNAGDVITYNIGGQDGYNGGGAASTFGNGGGATVVTSAEQGILLVAAGGGGATGNGDGGEGGVAAPGTLVSSGSTGESGAAGGGGGYLGGEAGSFHQHTEDCYITTTVGPGKVFYDSYSYSLINSGLGYIIPSSDKVYYTFGTSTAEGDSIRYTMQLGNTSTYFTTPESGVLSFDFFTGSNGGGTIYRPERIISIYSNRGNVIARIALNQLANTHTAQDISCSCGCGAFERCIETRIYNRDINGYYTGTETYNAHNGYFCEESGWEGHSAQINSRGTVYVPISESVDGVYIVIEVRYDSGGESGWTDHFIENVTYTYKATNCGLDEVSSPSYGGSSYINTALCNNYSYLHGSNTGNGYFTVQSENIGFFNGLKADGVPAPDRAAPDGVSGNTVTMQPVEGNHKEKVIVEWRTPADNGTDYYFKAESHRALTGAKLCISNIRMHTITTGVKGYYYLINTTFGTGVTAENAAYITERSLEVTLEDVVQYLHLAPVDGREIWVPH